MSNIVSLDVETAGTDHTQHKLIQVGMVALDEDLMEINRSEFYVCQSRYGVNEEAMKINGLSIDEVMRKGMLPFVASEAIKAFVEASFGVIDHKDKRPVMLGHNVEFDKRFIKQQLFDDVGSSFESVFSHRTICTHSILHFLASCGKVPYHIMKSHKAFEHFGIENKNAHTALSDALATRELYKKCIDLAMI